MLTMNVRGEFLTGEKQLAQVTGYSVGQTAQKKALETDQNFSCLSI
jgi:hypothetical protein